MRVLGIRAASGRVDNALTWEELCKVLWTWVDVWMHGN